MKEISKRKKIKENKNRNPIIIQAFNGGINLCTKVEKDKKKYSRKKKHSKKKRDDQ
jgi:hypothetical protein